MIESFVLNVIYNTNYSGNVNVYQDYNKINNHDDYYISESNLEYSQYLKNKTKHDKL